MSQTDTYLWSWYAVFYDQINYSHLYQELLSKVVQFADLQPNQAVLDAGCGTGNLTQKLLEEQSNLNITATDYNSGMLKQAKQKIPHESVTFLAHNLNQPLPFEDNVFDRVFSIHVLYALQNPEYTLTEFLRVLKPNGKLIFANPDEDNDMRAIMRDNLKLLPIWKKVVTLLMNVPIIIINILIVNRGSAGKFHFINQTDLREILTRIGYTNIQVTRAYADQDLLVTAAKV